MKDVPSDVDDVKDVPSDVEDDSDACVFLNTVPPPSKPKQTSTRKKQKTGDATASNEVNDEDTKVAHHQTKTDAKAKSTFCRHCDCDEEQCHENMFGWFCKEQCQRYMKSKNLNINEHKIFKVYQETYTCVLRYRLSKKGFEIEDEDIVLKVPTCMLNNSYSDVLNELYE